MPDQCRVVLVRPPINRSPNAPFFLPLGLLCVAAPLRDAGHDVEIVDYEFSARAGRFRLNDETWLSDVCGPLLERRPHLIGLTVLADTLPVALLIGRYLRRANSAIVIAMGGPGVFGVFPNLLREFSDAVDYVCMNEGELALTELADAIAAGDARPRIPGFWSLDTASGALVADGRELANVNDLPMPAYDAVPVLEYLEMAAPRIFDVYLGSGCTYKCKFCVTSTFWERDFRSKSPHIALAELQHLNANYGITQFNFLHDNFANRRAYLDEFITYFTEHNPGFEWGCAVRPDNVRLDDLKRMRDAGCFSVFCGTDAGSEKILRAMHKMPSTKRSYEFFENCMKLGIPFETNTIIGYPEETPEDLEAALEVVFDAISYGAGSSDVSILQPLPGAEVTAEYLASIEFVGDAVLGTFLPADAAELARSRLEILSGFGFLHYRNRSFEYYRQVLRLVRYFGRHFFLTLRYFKVVAGRRYVDVFEGLLGAAEDILAESIRTMIAGLPVDQQTFAKALYEYEAACDTLVDVDIELEIENVYSQLSRRGPGPGYTVVDLDADVVSMFPNGKVREGVSLECVPTTYLIYLSVSGSLVTMQLPRWQREVWEQLQIIGIVDADRISHAVTAAHDVSIEMARSAVERARSTFAQIQAELRNVEGRQLPL
jgi:Radical SAM superfamily/B12 binding domain